MAKNEKGLARNEHAGLEHVPAYRTSEEVPNAIGSKGIAVRPATYTNKVTKGAGVDNKAAFDKRGGSDLHV